MLTHLSHSGKLIGIYDETVLSRQLLHNKLEQLKFQVSFSCSEPKKLVEYINTTPLDILLINGRYLSKAINECTKKFLAVKPTNSIVLYGDMSESRDAETFKKRNKVNTHTTDNAGLEKLVDKIEEIIRINSPASDKNPVIRLSVDNPFFKIVMNPKYVHILQLLSEGKSNKQISEETSLSEPTVKTYIQKMRIETGYTNTLQMVCCAKDFKII